MTSDDDCIKLGDAFLLETPPYGMHLFIAIVPIDDNSFLFVNTTTKKSNSDTSCILKPRPGLPDFITHESVIAYKYAREIETEAIFSLIESGDCTRKGNCSPNILYQIQMGAITSRQIKNRYKKIMKDFLNIE